MYIHFHLTNLVVSTMTGVVLAGVALLVVLLVIKMRIAAHTTVIQKYVQLHQHSFHLSLGPVNVLGRNFRVKIVAAQMINAAILTLHPVGVAKKSILMIHFSVECACYLAWQVLVV